MVKWGVNIVVFGYLMIPETPGNKKVGTYWKFRLGSFLIRFLQVIFMKEIIDC